MWDGMRHAFHYSGISLSSLAAIFCRHIHTMACGGHSTDKSVLYPSWARLLFTTLMDERFGWHGRDRFSARFTISGARRDQAFNRQHHTRPYNGYPSIRPIFVQSWSFQMKIKRDANHCMCFTENKQKKLANQYRSITAVWNQVLQRSVAVVFFICEESYTATSAAKKVGFLAAAHYVASNKGRGCKRHKVEKTGSTWTFWAIFFLF